MAAAAVGLVAAGAASPSFLAGGKRSFDFLRYSEQVERARRGTATKLTF
jgi:hypothetical protein